LILLAVAVLGLFPEGYTSEWYSLLQSRYLNGCSADYLAAGESGVLNGELPMVAIGSLPEIPWSDAHMVDPLASGIWGGGKWNISVGNRSFQDSLSISRIGLMQNTEDHSRYIFRLDRPLPWGASGNFEILREDTLRLFSAVLNRGSLSMRTMSWEGRNYGWGSVVGWTAPRLYARTGFFRLNPGDRRPEVLVGGSTALSSFTFEAGAAASLVDSTVQSRAVAGISSIAGNARFSGYFEYADEGEGFWGGVTVPVNGIELSAAVSKPAGDKLFQMAALRHPLFNLVGRFDDEIVAAADAEAAMGFFRGKAAASWNFTTDSLSVVSWILVGRDWYRGRFEAGPRITTGMNSAGEFSETLDAVLGFTLVTFSISTAVEDITDATNRSWSFGITWSYTDQPPVTPVGETEGGRGN